MNSATKPVWILGGPGFLILKQGCVIPCVCKVPHHTFPTHAGIGLLGALYHVRRPRDLLRRLRVTLAVPLVGSFVFFGAVLVQLEAMIGKREKYGPYSQGTKGGTLIRDLRDYLGLIWGYLGI